MPPIDLGNRQPTVQRYRSSWWPFSRSQPPKPQPTLPPPSAQRKTTTSPFQLPRVPKPTPAPAETRTNAPAAKPRLRTDWLTREALALLGMAGAALTVFTQLAGLVPISRPFMSVLGWWVTLNSDLWLSAYDRLGFYPHAHVQAAIALAVFLVTIGLGARIAAKLTGTPLERRWSLFEGQTWPSLAIMGTLGIIFVLGHDPNAATARYDGYGGKDAVKYLFAIILATGYGLGDWLGQRGFHIRLYRLAVLLALLVALNFWLLPSH